MSGFRVSVYIKGVRTPSNPRPQIFSSLSSCGGQDSSKAILGLLHHIPSDSRRFGSPTPSDLQTLVGFLSPKVYFTILQDFFALRRSLSMHGLICLGVSLQYPFLALKSYLEWIVTSCKLKIRFSYLKSCNLPVNHSIQALSFEYVVLLVLVVVYVKFREIPTTDPWF